MKKISYKMIRILREKGYSYQKIANFLNIPVGTAYRIYRKGKGYSEKVGNKNRTKIFPLWQYLTPEYIYKDIFKLTMQQCRAYDVPFDLIIDYILDRLYHKDFSNIKKAKDYVYIFILRTVQHWDSHHWREISIEELQQ